MGRQTLVIWSDVLGRQWFERIVKYCQRLCYPDGSRNDNVLLDD